MKFLTDDINDIYHITVIDLLYISQIRCMLNTIMNISIFKIFMLISYYDLFHVISDFLLFIFVMINSDSLSALI